MKWALLLALLPAQATAPSPFFMQGYDTLAKCEAARDAVMRQRSALGKRVIIFAVCVPGNDAPAPSGAQPHKH